LGIASSDVRIISILPSDDSKSAVGDPTSVGSKFEIKPVAQFNEHGSQVWRVSWNITGTILASSGDDGCVRLWKANYLDNWKCVTVLKSDTNGHPLPE